MKKLLMLFLLFLVLPTVVWGYNDSCSFPKQYTVDKRCYVTEEQKKQKPYNAVVAVAVRYRISSGESGYCSGTIIKHDDGKLYLYTAKHCVKLEDLVEPTIVVVTQDGKRIFTNLNATGDYETTTTSLVEIENTTGNSLFGDWAIYELPSEYKNVAFTNFSDKEITWSSQQTAPYDALLIGYGRVKVMSDAEIENFKEKYIRYLKAEKNIKSDGTESEYFLDGGVNYGNYGPGRDFVFYLKANEKWYFDDIFGDNFKLKVSKCKISRSISAEENCQGSGGNSGGGIFDSDGNFMGVATRGFKVIGGERHGISVRGTNARVATEQIPAPSDAKHIPLWQW